MIRMKKIKGFRSLLKGYPQRKGIVIKSMIMKPRKPNSALRKIAKVKVDSTRVNVYIPGIGHNINAYSQVLIRGGRTQDLPGLGFKVIRGVLDASPVLRTTSRSKYGCKKHLLDLRKK